MLAHLKDIGRQTNELLTVIDWNPDAVKRLEKIVRSLQKLRVLVRSHFSSNPSEHSWFFFFLPVAYDND